MQSKETDSFIERYQSLYERDPGSKIFAPLAEAYRRARMLDRALTVAENGVRLHPHFASGRVALGKCYFEKKDFRKAAENFKIAVDLSPENILAHQLLAECETQLGRRKEALQAHKMVLFLNPRDEKTAQLVRKLEQEMLSGDFGDIWSSPSGGAKTAAEGSEAPNHPGESEEYSMKPLRAAAREVSRGVSRLHAPKPTASDPLQAAASRRGSEAEPSAGGGSPSAPDLERELARFDAWYGRGDWAKAQEFLDRLGPRFQSHQEVHARRQKLEDLTKTNFDALDLEWLSPLQERKDRRKIQTLEKWLAQIEERKKP